MGTMDDLGAALESVGPEKAAGFCGSPLVALSSHDLHDCPDWPVRLKMVEILLSQGPQHDSDVGHRIAATPVQVMRPQ